MSALFLDLQDATKKPLMVSQSSIYADSTLDIGGNHLVTSRHLEAEVYSELAE